MKRITPEKYDGVLLFIVFVVIVYIIGFMAGLLSSPGTRISEEDFAGQQYNTWIDSALKSPETYAEYRRDGEIWLRGISPVVLISNDHVAPIFLDWTWTWKIIKSETYQRYVLTVGSSLSVKTSRLHDTLKYLYYLKNK